MNHQNYKTFSFSSKKCSQKSINGGKNIFSHGEKAKNNVQTESKINY